MSIVIDLKTGFFFDFHMITPLLNKNSVSTLVIKFIFDEAVEIYLRNYF